MTGFVQSSQMVPRPGTCFKCIHFCALQEVLWWEDWPIFCLVGSLHPDADPCFLSGSHCLFIRMCNSWWQHPKVNTYKHNHYMRPHFNSVSKCSLYKFVWLIFCEFTIYFSFFSFSLPPPSMEICHPKNNITMCPLCDRVCSYWKLSTACGTARASHLFDNPATVFFSIFMALWGQ